ncbi:MAG: enoyl-CoA hydratase/isomerase family protein [Aestuariivirga sp.]
MYETILSEPGPAGVRTITLNRPKSLNAMNRTLIDELARAFDDANADESTQVIILTGAGRAFCAGDDLDEHVQPENEEAARGHIRAIQRVTEAICFGEKPVVGAINGWAVGGGFEWAINCDFPIWAESAKAFFPELKWGMFVTGGVTSLLPALAGLHVAREMMVFGERYDARTLLDKGVAWRVVPDDRLMSEAHAVARKLLVLSQRSLQAMKHILNRVATVDLKRSIEMETDATVASFLDPDTTRRIAEFSKT